MLADPGPTPLSRNAMFSYLTANKMLLNKIEVENLVAHFEVPTGEVDVNAFLAALMTDTSGDDPCFPKMHGTDSPHAAHLALSGVSHLEFGILDKPFPKHWGVPPNAQMKGHDGIMRDLPGAYGRGNAPMFNWVQQNLASDKKSETSDRGVKPYPFGNYSL